MSVYPPYHTARTLQLASDFLSRWRRRFANLILLRPGRDPNFVCDNPPLVLAGAFGSVVASVTPRPFRRSFGEAAARFRRSYGAVFVYNIFVLASSSVFLFVFDILDSRLPVACINFLNSAQLPSGAGFVFSSIRCRISDIYLF